MSASHRGGRVEAAEDVWVGGRDAANDPPSLFARNGSLVRIVVEDDVPRIRDGDGVSSGGSRRGLRPSPERPSASPHC